MFRKYKEGRINYDGEVLYNKVKSNKKLDSLRKYFKENLIFDLKKLKNLDSRRKSNVLNNRFQTRNSYKYRDYYSSLGYKGKTIGFTRTVINNRRVYIAHNFKVYMRKLYNVTRDYEIFYVLMELLYDVVESYGWRKYRYGQFVRTGMFSTSDVVRFFIDEILYYNYLRDPVLYAILDIFYLYGSMPIDYKAYLKKVGWKRKFYAEVVFMNDIRGRNKGYNDLIVSKLPGIRTMAGYYSILAREWVKRVLYIFIDRGFRDYTYKWLTILFSLKRYVDSSQKEHFISIFNSGINREFTRISIKERLKLPIVDLRSKREKKLDESFLELGISSIIELSPDVSSYLKITTNDWNSFWEGLDEEV